MPIIVAIQRNNASIQHNNMFITFHQAIYNTRNTIVENNIDRTLICPATIYVTATFHPTIGQCAHQSLSDTATPELGMISSRNKGTLVDSYIAKVQ